MEGVAAEPKPLVWGAHDIFKDGSVRTTVSALRSAKACTPRLQAMTTHFGSRPDGRCSPIEVCRWLKHKTPDTGNLIQLMSVALGVDALPETTDLSTVPLGIETIGKTPHTLHCLMV